MKVMLDPASQWVQKKLQKKYDFNAKIGKVRINPLLFQLKILE